MSRPKILTGVVHGRTVELDSDSGLPDGKVITMVVQPASESTRQTSLEDLQTAFGAWSDDDAGLDEYLDWTRRQRRVERGDADS